LPRLSDTAQGLVLRTCREMQREYFRPPVNEGNTGVGKYR
jgi:hypothetical protein